jgi:L-aspartate oxidase
LPGFIHLFLNRFALLSDLCGFAVKNLLLRCNSSGPDLPFAALYQRPWFPRMTADFLVIGAGVAGLSFALRAARHGSVIVLTKGDAYESNTAWAQGGIASVLEENQRDPGDSVESHVADTLDAGAGLCREAAVRTIIGEGAAAIRDLTDYGVAFDRANSHFLLGREGGHSHRRILHAKDTTGREIARALIETARQTPNLTLLEDHFVIDLITSGKLGAVAEDRVLGAYVLEKMTGEVRVFRSNRVILAAGGCGKVYLYTTNPDSATGDGVALGWRAGASVANMEFIQFHPTCFYNPGATGPEARSFLVSEAVRGEGGILINAKGADFTKKIDPRGSLAPRDIVARAIDRELKRTGAPCVYLDVTHKPAGFMRERFPYIHETLLRFGLDCGKQPIPVVPAAHYQCGGVLTDVNGKTTIRGLFAIGEAGCTGLHGANRLASNSLLEGNVIARRALEEILLLHPPGKEIFNPPEIPEWEHGDVAEPDELVVIYHNWDEIRRLMWDYVSIVRTDNRLRRAAARLANLNKEVRGFYWGHRVNSDILELRNLVSVASLIVECALRRKESRGLHFTLDHPESDDRYRSDTVIRKF